MHASSVVRGRHLLLVLWRAEALTDLWRVCALLGTGSRMVTFLPLRQAQWTDMLGKEEHKAWNGTLMSSRNKVWQVFSHWLLSWRLLSTDLWLHPKMSSAHLVNFTPNTAINFWRPVKKTIVVWRAWHNATRSSAQVRCKTRPKERNTAKQEVLEEKF